MSAAVPAGAAGAEDNGDDDAGMPDIELLEFLGSFSTEEGEWIDPQSLLEEDLSMLIDMAARRRTNERPANEENATDTQAGNDD